MKPNLFLIGAPKCGTSALATQLGEHPEIYLNVKEPRFFDARTFYDCECDHPLKTEQDYLRLYSSPRAAHCRYRIDASVFNMYADSSIKDILAFSPSAKFIVVLRDPLAASKSMHAQRLKSHHQAMREVSEDFCACWHELAKRRDGIGFPEACRNKMLFRYDLLYSYERYLPFLNRLIPPDRIRYVDYDVFRREPTRIHRGLLKFLEVEVVSLPTINVNLSYRVEPTRAGQMINDLIRSTAPIRRRLGLAGKKLRWLLPLLTSTEKRTPLQVGAHGCDEEIKTFFLQSSAAAAEVCGRHEMNRK